MPVIPAVPYLLLDLQDVQWAVENSRGARKLARTPHVNNKKKTPEIILISGPSKKKKQREREIKHFMQQRPQIPNIVWKILWRIVN
jgi:hypothetical protein